MVEYLSGNFAKQPLDIYLLTINNLATMSFYLLVMQSLRKEIQLFSENDLFDERKSLNFQQAMIATILFCQTL